MQVHALIRGRVQGVFFRAWTQQQARDLGLKGWVRNLADGSVELLAQGEKEPLAALLRLARQGPPAASVDELSVEWSNAEVPYSDFSIERQT